MHGEGWAQQRGVVFISKGLGREVTSVAMSGLAQFCSLPFPSRAILSEAQPPESQLPCWKGGLTEGLSWWQVALARRGWMSVPGL